MRPLQLTMQLTMHRHRPLQSSRALQSAFQVPDGTGIATGPVQLVPLFFMDGRPFLDREGARAEPGGP